MPSDRKLVSFMNDPDLVTGLKAVKERDGVPESEQIRRAIRAWLTEQGVLKKKAGKRKTKRS